MGIGGRLGKEPQGLSPGLASRGGRADKDHSPTVEGRCWETRLPRDWSGVPDSHPGCILILGFRVSTDCQGVFVNI